MHGLTLAIRWPLPAGYKIYFKTKPDRYVSFHTGKEIKKSSVPIARHHGDLAGAVLIIESLCSNLYQGCIIVFLGLLGSERLRPQRLLQLAGVRLTSRRLQ